MEDLKYALSNQTDDDFDANAVHRSAGTCSITQLLGTERGLLRKFAVDATNCEPGTKAKNPAGRLLQVTPL